MRPGPTVERKKNIDLEYEVAPGLPLATQDQGKLEQILNNLLSNAIKFTPDGGRINVTAHRDRRNDLRLTVADTGVGINESEQVLVFEEVPPGNNRTDRRQCDDSRVLGHGLGAVDCPANCVGYWAETSRWRVNSEGKRVYRASPLEAHRDAQDRIAPGRRA